MTTINNSNGNDINRGVELMLCKKRRENLEPKDESKKFSFGKLFSLLKRDIHFKIEIMVKNKDSLSED
jgi:hypothetical protein